MFPVSFSDVKDASIRLEGVVLKTPVVNSPKIDSLAGRRIFMKCENMQRIGAFKFRGASNAVMLLGEEAENGLCTHSSGKNT